MIEKILVPLDGSRLAEKALPYAEALAEKFEAELILLWVVQLPVPMVDHGTPYSTMVTFGPTVDVEHRQATEYLNGLQDELRGRHIPTRVLVVKSQSVADTIVDIAGREGVDVIVKTTHGRTGISRWIFGNVAAKVLQQAPCPVFLVRIQNEDR